MKILRVEIVTYPCNIQRKKTVTSYSFRYENHMICCSFCLHLDCWWYKYRCNCISLKTKNLINKLLSNDLNEAILQKNSDIGIIQYISKLIVKGYKLSVTEKYTKKPIINAQ